MQKIGAPSLVMIETTGFCVWAGCAGILAPSSPVEVRRIVADRAHMKVVVRTFGRDANVADWLTSCFQIITIPPSLVDINTVMVVSWRGAAPERLIRL